MLKESFGADGQPGSYADLDVCDVLFCFGHNAAAAVAGDTPEGGGTASASGR
jgi:anaerobic selenocysteine-containing dehydrogenase